MAAIEIEVVWLYEWPEPRCTQGIGLGLGLGLGLQDMQCAETKIPCSKGGLRSPIWAAVSNISYSKYHQWSCLYKLFTMLHDIHKMTQTRQKYYALGLAALPNILFTPQYECHWWSCLCKLFYNAVIFTSDKPLHPYSLPLGGGGGGGLSK